MQQLKRGVRSLLLASLLLQTCLIHAGPGSHPTSGRKIANVCGLAGADWLVRPEREQEERPELALDLLNIKSGMTVADIGAGVGYFSLKLARRVGAEGKVLANDIQPEMLRLLRQRANKAGVTNIEEVLGTMDDPKLPANSVDLVLLADVYHEFSHPRAMLVGIRKALKQNGRLVLLEYRKEDPSIPILEDHKMTIQQVRDELEPEGFRFDAVLHDLPRQHILIFRKSTL